MKLLLNCAVGLVTLCVVVNVALADWPEFRGPTGDGHAASQKALPVKWSETENVKWKTAIHGAGWATPIVMDGKVWVATATPDGRTMSVVCVDQETGKVLLDRVLTTNENPEPLSNKMNNYAACSPAAEKGRVYVHFGSYGTFCLDSNNFQEIWRRTDLQCSHWRGPGSSVVLWKDTLILTFDGVDQQYLTALDKKTGKTVWIKNRSTNFNDLDKDGKPTADGDLRKAYSTPIFIEVGGKMIMVSTGAKACWAYNPDTGEELWNVNVPQHSVSSRPVYHEKLKLLYINTGLGKPQLWAVRVDPKAKGEITDTHVAWKLIKRVPKMSSPILVGDELYLASDTVGACVDARTGDVLWSERLGGSVTASLIYGNGQVYFFDEDGGAAVVQAGREFKLTAKNKLDDGSLASPAASDGSLFVRSKGFLYRIGE